MSESIVKIESCLQTIKKELTVIGYAETLFWEMARRKQPQEVARELEVAVYKERLRKIALAKLTPEDREILDV